MEVETGDWLVFTPDDPIPQAGFIFYPGGKVEPEAYAPPVRLVAEAGYLSIIVPMPLDLAILGTKRADDVVEAYPEVDTWVIAGHSLGGVAASSWAGSNPDIAKGLSLWASYPGEGDGLADGDTDVAMVYGSQDCRATPEEVLATEAFLPNDTLWIEIEGGNHAQFGSYGPQEDDCEANISTAEQHAQASGSVITLFQGLGF